LIVEEEATMINMMEGATIETEGATIDDRR
jgi:hypothetical protein